MKQRLRNLINEGKIVIGSEKIIKMLLKGEEFEEIIIAKNTPVNIQEEIKRYADVNNVNVEILDVTNEELGVICKKPFHISVLGIKK